VNRWGPWYSPAVVTICPRTRRNPQSGPSPLGPGLGYRAARGPNADLVFSLFAWDRYHEFRPGNYMVNKSWSQPTSWDEVCRRAAGRAKYHAIRRLARAVRRGKVMELLSQYGMGRGVQARISRELGCARSTICVDVRELMFKVRSCPTCGHILDQSNRE
jgi:hypothetical protein